MQKTIYAIKNNVNNKLYVGVCQCVDTRIKKHMHDLMRGVHTNKHLQSDFDKYGMEFSFYLIEENVNPAECFERERFWINILRSNEKQTGYNLSKQEQPITDLSKFKRVYLRCIRGELKELLD